MSGSDALIDSAVLLPLYRDADNRLRLVIIRRGPGGFHGGQLAFPGGRHETEDNSMLVTALRETQEEIGLAPDNVHILAELPPIETKATGFRIFPFLGSITPSDWTVDKKEIVEVIDFDLQTLTDPSLHGEEVVQYDNWPVPRLIAFYRIGNYKLWGASFRILEPLLPRIFADEWQI
jgi:8-oxo-dGTP pyrophosphatase MutT (NUDIX family)